MSGNEWLFVFVIGIVILCIVLAIKYNVDKTTKEEEINSITYPAEFLIYLFDICFNQINDQHLIKLLKNKDFSYDGENIKYIEAELFFLMLAYYDFLLCTTVKQDNETRGKVFNGIIDLSEYNKGYDKAINNRMKEYGAYFKSQSKEALSELVEYVAQVFLSSYRSGRCSDFIYGQTPLIMDFLEVSFMKINAEEILVQVGSLLKKTSSAMCELFKEYESENKEKSMPITQEKTKNREHKKNELLDFFYNHIEYIAISITNTIYQKLFKDSPKKETDSLMVCEIYLFFLFIFIRSLNNEIIEKYENIEYLDMTQEEWKKVRENIAENFREEIDDLFIEKAQDEGFVFKIEELLKLMFSVNFLSKNVIYSSCYDDFKKIAENHKPKDKNYYKYFLNFLYYIKDNNYFYLGNCIENPNTYDEKIISVLKRITFECVKFIRNEFFPAGIDSFHDLVEMSFENQKDEYHGRSYYKARLEKNIEEISVLITKTDLRHNLNWHNV